MAILEFEGFEFCSDDHYITKGVLTGSTWSVVEGRINGRAMYCNTDNGSDSYYIFSQVPNTQTEVAVGAALKWDAYAGGRELFYFKLDANYSTVRFGSDGHLYFTKSGTLLPEVGSHLIKLDTWYYIEVFFQLSDSTTKHCLIYVNGEVDLVLPLGSDTNPAATQILNVKIGQDDDSRYNFWIDDCYIADGSGDFLGDCHIEALRPNGTGNQSDLIGSDGDSTDNYSLVNEYPADTGIYVSSSGLNDLDLYTFENMPYTPETIHGISTVHYVNKTQPSRIQVGNMLRVNSTNYLGSGLGVAAGSATPTYDTWFTNPDTGLPWQVSDINDIELGPTLIL